MRTKDQSMTPRTFVHGVMLFVLVQCFVGMGWNMKKCRRNSLDPLAAWSEILWTDLIVENMI